MQCQAENSLTLLPSYSVSFSLLLSYLKHLYMSDCHQGGLEMNENIFNMNNAGLTKIFQKNADFLKN
jgi:hypothetical protein